MRGAVEHYRAALSEPLSTMAVSSALEPSAADSARSEGSGTTGVQPLVFRAGTHSPATKGVTRRRGAAAKKKRVYLPQQVKNLAVQVEKVAEALQRLTVDNLRARARERMLSLLLTVKTRVRDRETEIACGLAHNPFAHMGGTVEDVRDATPEWIAHRSGRVMMQAMHLYAAGRPLLDAHPELKAPLHELYNVATADCPTPPAAYNADRLATYQPATEVEAAQLRDLKAMTMLLQCHVQTFRYIFLLLPQAMDGISGNKHLIMRESSWAAVRDKALEHAARPDPAGGWGCDSNGRAPRCAPTEHWQAVVSDLALSDTQLLHAAVLHDVLSSARCSVAAQRAMLMSSLACERQGGGGVAEGVACKGPEELGREQELLDQLTDTVAQDRLHFLLADEVLMMDLLTPMQAAMALTHSMPYVVDVWGLLHAAASRCTPDVMARLGAAQK